MKNCNKLLACCAGLLLSACNSGSSGSSSTEAATSRGWTWLSGSNESNAYSVYGLQNIPQASNVPGARYIPLSWLDSQGNLWQFGGLGNAASGASGNLNDLWRYQPSSQEWTWVSGSNLTNVAGVYASQGVAAASNLPGGRFGGVSWLDSQGNLWLFGGYGNDEFGVPGSLNDLWRYNPTSGIWTWMKGSKTIAASGIYGIKGVADQLNTPGARLGSVSWSDNNGNLWLFGGASTVVTGSVYNDLWKYTIADNRWTWVSGSDTTNSFGVYGIQGIAALANHPGARVDTVGWADNSNNLWLFAGSGVDADGRRGDLNDVWQYNISSDRWTWMSGSNKKDAPGSYGTQGVASPNSIPGAREHRIPVSRANSNGTSFWMFGGYGYGASTQGLLNDLWTYNETSNQWTWISGSMEAESLGVYAVLGSLSPSNMPGARKDGVGWVDQSGNFWLFAGSGYGASSNGYLNDLWRYSPY